MIKMRKRKDHIKKIKESEKEIPTTNNTEDRA